MTVNGWIQILLFCAAVAAITKPLGRYLTDLLNGDLRGLAPVERRLYRLAGVDPRDEQHWLGYAMALLAFNVAGFAAALRADAPAGRAAAQSRRASPAVPPSSRLQHRGQLRHQHQLAGLRRRDAR